MAVAVEDLVREIIDSVLEDVVTIESERVETECKEKDETSVNNNSEVIDDSRILRDLQPQPLQARKRASEADLEDEVKDKKMKNSTGEIIDLTSLSPDIQSIKNNPKVGRRFKNKNNNSSEIVDLCKD